MGLYGIEQISDTGQVCAGEVFFAKDMSEAIKKRGVEISYVQDIKRIWVVSIPEKGEILIQISDKQSLREMRTDVLARLELPHEPGRSAEMLQKALELVENALKHSEGRNRNNRL